MSYDLYVVRRDIPENFWDYGYDPDYDYGCYFNYTYNLGPFFAAVLFSVLFFALVAYLGWAEETANTIILREGSRSYACQTSRISQAPHNCKPVKEKS